MKTWRVRSAGNEVRLVEASTAEVACKRFRKAMAREKYGWGSGVVEVELVSEYPVVRGK